MARDNYYRINGTILRHYGVKGMKWGLHRKSQPNGNLGLWYTGKRLSKSNPYPRGYKQGTSALLPAISPNTSASLSRSMNKRYSTIINSKTTAKGKAFVSKKLKVGITLASVAATALVGAAVFKAIKKRREKKVKDEDEQQ